MNNVIRLLSATGVAVAATSMLIMMLLTIADIIGRHVFGHPILGVYELVQLMLTGSVFGGLAEACRTRAHITVDLIDGIAPRLATRILQPLAAAATVLTIAGLLWAGLLQAYDSYRFGDTTMDLRISKLWFWTPIMVGLLAGVITALVPNKQSEA